MYIVCYCLTTQLSLCLSSVQWDQTIRPTANANAYHNSPHATARPKVQTSSICFSTGASTRSRESHDQCRSVSELLHMRFFIQHTGIILGNSTCNKIPALDLWGLTHATIASVPGRPVQSFLAFSFSFTSSQQKRSSVWIKSHGQCKIWDFLQLQKTARWTSIATTTPAWPATWRAWPGATCPATRPTTAAWYATWHATPSAWSSRLPRLATWTWLESVVSSGSSGIRPPAPQCFWGCFCSVLEGVNRKKPLNSSYLREWSQMLANASFSFQTLKLKQQNVLHISTRPQRLYFVQETRNLRSMKWRSQKWRWKNIYDDERTFYPVHLELLTLHWKSAFSLQEFILLHHIKDYNQPPRCRPAAMEKKNAQVWNAAATE